LSYPIFSLLGESGPFLQKQNMYIMDLKFVFIIFFLIFNQPLFSQQGSELKTIKASSEKVDIRVGDDYVAKGGWHLDSTQKPDIFSIGSKWNYETLKVSFITDLDSITIDAKPNNKYDFIVLLNEKTPCHIQVVTAPNPVFMDWRIISFLGAFCFIVCIMLFRLKSLKQIKILLLFGFISPLLFWCFTILASSFLPAYDHSKNVISELGTIGSNAEVFTSTSLIILSLSSLMFSVGFIKSSQFLKLSKLPAISTCVLPASSLWAAIFPLGNEFHGLLGPMPLLLIVGVALSLSLWKGTGFKSIRKFSTVALFLLLMISLRFIPSFGQAYEGLIQRFFYIGWTVWLFAIAYDFRKKLNEG